MLSPTLASALFLPLCLPRRFQAVRPTLRSVLATGGCAGAGMMPLTIALAPSLITSGAVQPVPAHRQADGDRAEAAVADKLRQKNDNNKEQKKRKRAQKATEVI